MKIQKCLGIFIMGVIALIITMLGCGKQEKTIKFSALTQEEKQEYVREYLSINYGLECTFTEIKERQITAVKNERDYSTIASTNDDFRFSIWITPQGEIKDTAFTYQIKDDVNNYFSQLLEKNGIDCIVNDKFVFESYPSKKWNSDEIACMYEQENIDNVFEVFTDQEIVDAEVVKDALKNYRGVVGIHCNYKEKHINNEKYDYIIELD